MSKITTNNSAKKLRLLKYSLLASISAAAIIAIPFEGVASSKDTYQDIMEYKKALNRASSVKRRPSTKKGRESLKSNDSSQDIKDFYKNSSPVQHLEKERYTPTPRKKTSPDNFNSSGDKTFVTANNTTASSNASFVTANNTLPSTLSTSFDQMEYKYMALRKDVQMKMDKIDSAIEQSQGNNKKSLKQAKSSLSKKQKAILNAANIEEQIIELKKADSSSREENKIKELVKELKKSEKKVEKAYSDIETSFNELKLETETIISSGFDTSTVQQEPNSQSNFKPAQASTPKKRGVFSRVFSKGKKLFQDADTSAEEPTKLTKSQEQLQRTKAAKQGVADKNKATADEVKRKSLEYQAQIEQDENERIEKIRVDKEAQKKAQEVRKKQAAEAYAAAKKKNNIEEARIQKKLLMVALETEIEKKRVLLNNQESEQQVQDNLNQLERIKKILNQNPESLEATREGIGRIGSYEDKTVAEKKLLKIEKKQEKQEDLKLKIIGELAKEKPNHSDIKKYYEKVERISGEIKTEIGQITFPPQPPARNKNNTNNVSIPVTPRVQRIVDNSKYDSGGYLKPNPPSVQDYIEVFPDPVVNVQPQKEDQPKQHPTFTQADLNVRMLPLVETYVEVGGLIKNLQKTPSSSQQKLIDTSLASIKKEQKNLENIIQELNILRLKLVNKPQNEISYNRRIEEKLAEAKQIESRINGYQDKIKTNVGFIAANKEDTHIVPKNNLALLGHQNIEYSLHRINSANSNKRPVLFDRLLKDLNKKKDEAKAVWEQFIIYKENKERKDLNGDENRQIEAAEALLKQYNNDIKLVEEAFENYKEDSRKSNGIQSPASSNLEYLALEEKFTSLRKHDELDEELQKVSTKKSNVEAQYHELRRKRLNPENSQSLQDLAQKALNLSKQESQLQQDIEDLGSTPSSSNSSDSEVEIKVQGYSANPPQRYDSGFESLKNNSEILENGEIISEVNDVIKEVYKKFEKLVKPTQKDLGGLDYLDLEDKVQKAEESYIAERSEKPQNLENVEEDLRLKKLAIEALNLSKQLPLQAEVKSLEDDSLSDSSDSDVEIKAQGYSATPLKKYASVHSISHLVGSKEDLSVEFEKLVEAESLNNESKTDRENIDPKLKTEFKEIMDGFDRVAADINSELETLTAAKGLNDQPNANIGTKTEDASDQLLLSTNEHSSLGVSNGREDKPSSSRLSDGGKSEHRLLGVISDGKEDEDRFLGLSDGSDDEHGLLALSDGRESENDSLKLKDGDDKRSFLRLKSGEKDEDSFLKLIDSDDDYDSGIEEDLEYSKPLKKIDAITTIPLPQAVEEVKKSVAAIAPTTNQQIQTVQKVTKDSIFTRLDSIAVVKINEDNNAAIAAGDEESPVKRGLWMRTMYGVNNQGRVNNINGYRGINKGGTVGFDVEIDNNIIGIAYSNVHSVFKFKNNNNNDKEIIKSHIVSIYGQKELPKNFVLQGLVAASKNFIKNKTTYLFNNTKFKSNVKHRNHSYNAEALLNYNYLAKNNIVITPNIGLRYGKSRDGVYNETGISIQEIALATKENNILSGIIGAKTKIPLKNNNLGLTLHSSIEHNFNEKTQRVNRTIQIQGNKFTQNHIIPKQAKTAYNLGGGIIGSVKNTIISLDYNYYLNKRYHSHQGSIKLKVNL
ncbi:MAG: autotransporter domain-containing protein [Rickettsia endosymbiont of Graphium doson]|nr:autotransporter domain-containing protein [Rickettsia endosymbiont of Graphium doson]